MTPACDGVRERRFLGLGGDGDEAHVASCPRCRREAEALGRLAATFAAARVAAPPPTLAPRVVAAARPLLAARRRYAARRSLATAVAAALVPLPLILVVDAWMLRAVYDGLSRFFPAPLSFFLVGNYAAVLALLGALTYGAIPLLAERQARGRHEASYG